MPKSSKSKTKCKCGDCARCQNKKLLRVKMMMNKKQNELKMKMANSCSKNGNSINNTLKYNPETDRVEILGFAAANNMGDENTMDMIKTLCKIDGEFYNLKID